MTECRAAEYVYHLPACSGLGPADQCDCGAVHFLDSIENSMSADKVRDMLRAACEAAGSQKAWAAANRVSTAYTNDVLTGRREPGDAICAALGVCRVVAYRKLSETRNEANLRQALLTVRVNLEQVPDIGLHRQALIDYCNEELRRWRARPAVPSGEGAE